MQHLCHLRFMVNIIDVSIMVITVRVCGMILAGSNISFFVAHTMKVYQQRWQTKQKIHQFTVVKTCCFDTSTTNSNYCNLCNY